jgi:hypothetical protein
MSHQLVSHELYQKPGDGRFVSPFDFSLEPMERLLLINMERDPDQVYLGFEPQVFDDDNLGRGMRILAYRQDKKIDVYQQPGMRAVKEDFDVAGKGCENLVERPLQDARFEMTGQGLNACFAFEDIQGRPIEVEIAENDPRPPKLFSLLAPLGSSTENPPALPLFFMFDFGFVRKAGTKSMVKIADKQHRLDSLPLPFEGQRVFFTRYSLNPFLMTWNNKKEGPLVIFEDARDKEIESGPARYSLVDNDGHMEIDRIQVSNDKHSFGFSFSPPVPDITGLREGVEVEGKFYISGNPKAGKVSGTYSLQRTENGVEMVIQPSGGWQPNERLFTLRLIYRIASVFRTWPKTYCWKAVFTETERGWKQTAWQQKAGWRRTNR